MENLDWKHGVIAARKEARFAKKYRQYRVGVVAFPKLNMLLKPRTHDQVFFDKFYLLVHTA